MAEWRISPHHEVPAGASVLGLANSEEVQWYDAAEGPPVNDFVPMVLQSGNALSCTMGVWHEYPTSYAYQWKLDGTDAGTNSSTYPVQAGDVGKSATCVVTATNAFGSTAAPPSNAVVITA